ncbi:hypothetical protein PC117_g11568 [Phytophthora cactorum]|uniref:Uncharacterized protein n=1 Tax=Phytophthora cactorum TaxID=29920 RepID=A0A8T1DCW9_9STRA|nr:hypothetical protein PC117_g11568 [Phytophthora cactorum]
MKAARSLAATAALICLHGVAATSSLPSIKLGFNIQRSTMEVYGASSFDVYVRPVLSGANVTFDGKVTFEQDGTTHNLYVVDRVPYHEVVNSTTDSTTCLPTELFPSVPEIVDAIASATAVSAVNTDQDISCTNGTWLSTTFAGESYVLCTGTDAEDGNFTVYGEDLSISFEYLSEDVTITKPMNAPSDCSAVSDGSVALSSLGQLYGITMSRSRRVLKEEAAAVHLASSTCTCQGTPRPCLFFHGMDVTTDGGIVDSYSFFGLLAGGLLIPHHSSKNDGIVEFQSCIGNLDSSSFQTTYSTTWYAAALNHADTTFHNGEGLFSSAKKPLKWFECLL